MSDRTEVIDVRYGGRIFVTSGDEEVQLEVSDRRGIFTRTYLAPDELHKLVLALRGEDGPDA